MQRLERRLDKSSLSGCWEWQGYRTNLGYGLMRLSTDRSMVLTHRAAWMLMVGPIPDGMLVCHHCDNPPCCNPAHLFLGTGADNTADRVRKGRSRSRPRRGEESPAAKVTATQVAEIRARYAAGDVYQRELGEEFGLSQTQVGRIVRGVRWAHVAH